MKVLLTKEEIARRVAELGAEITQSYQGKDLTVVVILNGALLFASDLVRQIELPLRIDSFAASSYEHDHSSGTMTVRSHLKLPVQNRNILLIDDILDTGLSMKFLVRHFQDLGAASVKTCVLLDKMLDHKHYGKVDWCGFRIPNRYVVGYGLDSEEMYRHLPYIAIIE